MTLDMKDFVNRAEFCYDENFGIVARMDDKKYMIFPAGRNRVSVVGHEGDTLGFLTMDFNTDPPCFRPA